MNVYDKNHDILYNKIKDLLNVAIYQNIKYELNNLTKNNNLNENNKIKIKKIIELIKQPQQLLNNDINIRFSFCNSPDINNDIFKPILSNKILINNIIVSIDNSILNDQIKIYFQSHKSFCEQLVEKMKSKTIRKPLEYLDELPLFINEKLEKYEVKSNHLAYKLASYDPVQYKYTKKNESGNSIGTVVNNVYFKYDKGVGLLKPAKEYAIYQLYKYLFPSASSTFVTPTQLIVLDNLKILNEDSPILKKLGSLKTQYNQQDVETILENEPKLRTELINALEESHPFFIQSSLFVKGQTFQKLLIDHQEQSNQDFNFEQIDMESYSSHIIASLLVIHSDYKADNLILEDGTNRIIGIDNDECLCDNEIKGNKTQIRNILFTFKTLMDKPIHQSVREQFIKHDPYIFIFKWLLQLESKQIEYEQLIQTIYEFKIFNDENQKQIILKNQNSEINLPLIFKINWISSMLYRFKEIKNLLVSEETINHQQLFQFIHPTSNSYYEYLSNKHPNKPLDIIYNVYFSTINDDFIDKNQNNKEEEYQSNIKVSILELIKYKEYCENEDSGILNEWMFLVFEYLKDKQFEDFQFHESWYLNNINIFFKLLKFGSGLDLLDTIISKLNISDIHQVFTYMIENLSNKNIYENIEFLISRFKMDLKDLENEYLIKGYLINAKGLLDMAFNFDQKGNFKLFLAFLKHGLNRSIDENKFNNFYQSLSHEQKLELKPYLLKLFNINNKINWKTSINQLFPIVNIESLQNNNLKTLETIKGYKRIISDEYWNQLFSSNSILNKSNNYGTRSVVFISDEYGNGIYVKFYPQLPGTEIAINKLSQLLFGFLTPICELASIDNIPILLIQQIPGDTLFDALKKDQDIINKIEPSNLSKQLIFAMISNNGDGNLANFIVVKNNRNELYNIYSIDNDQSFMPSVSKRIGYTKKSLQVSTVLLLFNQMNDKVHQQVINCIKNLNIDDILKRWLIYLKPQHDLAISHFKTNRIDNNETIIGVSFHDGMISQIYSKLQSLKQIFNKPKSSTLTYLNILEIIEPLVIDRYKPIILLNLSVIDKYNKLQNIIYSEKSITCSKNPSIPLLESRFITSATSIQNQLINGKYGPSQALNELEILKNQFLNFKKHIQDIKSTDNNHNQISKFDLECFLKSNFNEIKEKTVLDIIYQLIILKEPSIIYFRNNNDLNIKIIKSFKLDSIIKLEILECNILDSLSGFLLSKLFFKCLVKLKLYRCEILNTIRINAPKLKKLEVSNCKQIKTLDIESQYITYLDLKGSISKNIDQSKLLEKFKYIEYLNISETDYETISINLEYLKRLNVCSMKNLNIMNLETPSIQTIYYEGCNKLYQVISISNYNANLLKIFPIQYLNGNILSDFEKSKTISMQAKDLIICEFTYDIKYLSKFHNTILLKRFQLNKNTENGANKSIKDIFKLDSIEKDVEYVEFWDLYNDELLHGIIPNSVENLYLGKIKFPLLVGSIPSKVKKLELSDEFNQQLNPGTIPQTVNELYIGNILYSLSPNIIPSSVQSLTFGRFFNQPLSPGIIPSSVQSLTFGYWFDQPLSPGTIPSSVQSLTFGYWFDQPLSPGTIPSSVQTLEFGYWFDQPLSPGTIPSSVQSLTFGDWFDQPLSLGTIPSSVQTLKFGYSFDQPLSPGTIPSSVQTLKFGYSFDQTLSPGTIPSNVQTLKFGYSFDQPLSPGTIPSSVQTLKFGYSFDQPLSPCTIPSSVQSLTFGDWFDQPLSPGIIPSSVQSLTFGYWFDQPLSPGTIPSSVQSLTFGYWFNQPLSPGIIPSSVQSLTFGYKFNQTLSHSAFPFNFQSLRFSRFFKQPLSPGTIPSSVQLLKIGNKIISLNKIKEI